MRIPPLQAFFLLSLVHTNAAYAFNWFSWLTHVGSALEGQSWMPWMTLYRPAALPDLYEASVTELQAGLDAGRFTSVNLVKAYFARIDEVNLKGPQLRAVIETNPFALEQAATLDRERRMRGKRGLLHGIPVLLKDNMATVASEGMNTTAGSFALLNSIVPGDAGVVKKLRAAGAIILGKANLSEWARFRGNLASGWSGRGGQCTNAYYPNADPAGSSSGSGVAASIGLAAVTLGTETDGSITAPSSINNIVGIKPTVGLTSRAGVIPVSEHQDTVGPMTRSVADAAAVLSVIAGKDPNDEYTLEQPTPLPDYMRALKTNALNGKRIGVPRETYFNDYSPGMDPSINVAFKAALETIKSLGATVVDPADFPSAKELREASTVTNELFVFAVDFKVQLNDYLSSLKANPSGVRNLTDLIEFNKAHREREMPEGYSRQTDFVASEATTGRNATFKKALASNRELGTTRGIDAALQEHRLDALVLPMLDRFVTLPPALAGYPIVTVPLGFYSEDVKIGPAGPNTVFPAPGLPFGLCFIGTAYSEFDLISFAYAYEQKTQTRLARKAYTEAIPKTQLKDILKH